MVKFICHNFSAHKNYRILDVGCGNGHLLNELFREGFHNLVGTDYSLKSIELARSIAASHSMNDIDFIHADLLNEKFNIKADIICDKGTFDAVSLGPLLEGDVSPDDVFISRIRDFLSDSGIFLITSCNWTSSELRSKFEKYKMKAIEEIEYPQVMFGGVKGQNVTTIAFGKA